MDVKNEEEFELPENPMEEEGGSDEGTPLSGCEHVCPLKG